MLLMKKNICLKKRKKKNSVFNIGLPLPPPPRNTLGLKKNAFKGNKFFSVCNNIKNIFNFKKLFMFYFCVLRLWKTLCPNLYIIIGKGRTLLKECYFSTVY